MCACVRAGVCGWVYTGVCAIDPLEHLSRLGLSGKSCEAVQVAAPWAVFLA